MRKFRDTPDQNRRRLAKGAAGVVLSSLLAKPVLGAAPYNCTISGQLSGNTSSHGDAVSCSSLGRSPTYWIDNPGDWPATFTAGTLPGTGFCVATTPGTLFRDVAFGGYAYADAYRCRDGQLVQPGDADFPAAAPMSLLQVLNLDAGPGTPLHAALGAASAAAFLSAVKFGTAFPLTHQDIIIMFNSVYQGGTYTVKPGVDWGALDVTNYLKTLYS